ncbi:MAG: DUF1697 domain-containing protein [Myxococcales bacterium]|nr:DUF1697 domain-containing protein [Myxococcales bacterium]MCB9581945.1 DUF1697 domain-containing protein [Polyangiaceae bacterium]
MPRYVAFLRAVNVGKRTVPMARLKEELEALGFSKVSTFLNSGNAVFESRAKAESVEKKIETALEKAFGFEVPTLVRSWADVERIAAHKPYGDVTKPRTHMVAFLRNAPGKKVAQQIEALSNDVDTLKVKGREVHWLIEGGVSGTSLKGKDWGAMGGETTTTRNTTMLRKLVDKFRP